MRLDPGGTHILDTSAVILMMRNGVTAGRDALIPFATLGELLTGQEMAGDTSRERTRLSAALGVSRIIYPTLRIVEFYARISAHLRRIGRPIPPNDVWIAAIALEWNLPLLTADRHFERIPNLTTISVW